MSDEEKPSLHGGTHRGLVGYKCTFPNPHVKGQQCSGTVRFAGRVGFASGVWIGIEADNAGGVNDGSVYDIQYFTCERPGKTGIFMKLVDVDITMPEHSVASRHTQHWTREMDHEVRARDRLGSPGPLYVPKIGGSEPDMSDPTERANARARAETWKELEERRRKRKKARRLGHRHSTGTATSRKHSYTQKRKRHFGSGIELEWTGHEEQDAEVLDLARQYLETVEDTHELTEFLETSSRRGTEATETTGGERSWRQAYGLPEAHVADDLIALMVDHFSERVETSTHTDRSSRRAGPLWDTVTRKPIHTSEWTAMSPSERRSRHWKDSAWSSTEEEESGIDLGEEDSGTTSAATSTVSAATSDASETSSTPRAEVRSPRRRNHMRLSVSRSDSSARGAYSPLISITESASDTST